MADNFLKEIVLVHSGKSKQLMAELKAEFDAVRLKKHLRVLRKKLHGNGQQDNPKYFS